jgi:DNA polymerase-3 subunit gamma/tau
VNWFVSVSQKEGGPTLAEAEARSRDDAISDARSDPAVAAVLAAFPGARILDVRMPPAPDAADPDEADGGPDEHDFD